MLTRDSCPHNSVLVFIITILLLAADFYYLKNIAGRRLVGLRWWNEVDPQTGDSKWVFESSEPGTKVINATDSRFFWLANYAQPLLWVALAILALVRFMFIWLPLVGECTPPLPPPLFYTRPLPATRVRGASLRPQPVLGRPGVVLRVICADDEGKWAGWLDDWLTAMCSGIAMALTITNSLAFSRCDKFSQASNIAGGAFSASGLAGNIASGMVGRLFGR